MFSYLKYNNNKRNTYVHGNYLKETKCIKYCLKSIIDFIFVQLVPLHSVYDHGHEQQ